MKIMRKIEKLKDEELKQFVVNRINLLERKQKKKNISDTIGYLLDYNAASFDLLDFTDDVLQVQMICKFDGYIPLKTKIVYGMIYDPKSKIASNGGNFYYLDDDKYILNFCKYSKDKEVFDEFELFDCILEFCQKYFGVIEILKKEEMIKLIYKNDRAFFDPINVPKFSLFKGKGNNLCSEIGVMVQNILSFLGFNISLIIGTLKLDDENMEAHAFNMLDFKHSKTKEDLSILLDIASPVYVVDMNYEKIGVAPYVHYLDKCKNEIFKDLIIGNSSEIKCTNHSYMYTLQNVLKLDWECYRHYSIGTTLKRKKVYSKKI